MSSVSYMEFMRQIFLVFIVFACTALTERISINVVTSHKASVKRFTGPNQVCYDHVGCFSHAAPFNDRNFVLPKSPEVIGTTFQLFTRDDLGSNDTFFLNYTDIETLNNTSFNPDKKTKFIIHGFFNDITTEWPYEIKDELLKKGDFNVINVAWGPGAAFPDYLGAVANTRVVAKQMELVIDMMVSLGARYEDFHLIGHSLGAHTSGQVGQALRARNITLARITGMDPAEPNYKDHPKAMRLDKQDAAFVDVIHTNGAPYYAGGAGLYEPCGDVDFYVNGGLDQPDCPNAIAGLLGSLFGGGGSASAIGDKVSCSHSRSHEVFAESINSDCPFTSYPCSDYKAFQNGDCLSCGPEGCGTLGYYADWYYATGMMFLNTRLTKPFCGHHYAMKAKVSSQSVSTTGSLKIQLNGTWGVSEWVNINRNNKQSLQPNGQIKSVVVTNGIIGRVMTANVKYVRSSSRVNNEVKLEQISFLSGESGKKYLLCLNSTLSTGVTQTYPVTEQKECIDKA